MKLSHRVLLGVAPTHRHEPGFVPETAIRYKELIFKRLRDMGVEFIDLEDICEYGLLFSAQGAKKAEEKFRAAGVDAIFFPYCDFGCEGAVAQLAHAMQLPVLIWGHRDATGHGDDGDAQCGLAATGKVLRRFGVPFTFFPTCYVEDELFERGVSCFIAAANVVKNFRSCTVLQIGPRPESFWSVICNEGELARRFGIKVHPIPLSEIVAASKRKLSDAAEAIDAITARLKARCNVLVSDEVLRKSAALKLAIEEVADEALANCCTIQCWSAFQDEFGIWPCTAGALLNEEGFPFVCEGDIHGAITQMIASAAAMGKTTAHFGEWNFRHPTLQNVEFMAHCGCSAIDLFGDTPSISTRQGEENAHMGGHVSGLIKGGPVDFLRFDDDGDGSYSMLLGSGKALDDVDVCQRGARMWLEVPDILELEDKIVKGPYIHHCCYIHADILPVLQEALPYMNGVKADYVYADQKERTRRFLLRESMPNGPEGKVVERGPLIF